jgi:hypothetical protein
MKGCLGVRLENAYEEESRAPLAAPAAQAVIAHRAV